jgi:hypothetical protein
MDVSFEQFQTLLPLLQDLFYPDTVHFIALEDLLLHDLAVEHVFLFGADIGCHRRGEEKVIDGAFFPIAIAFGYGIDADLLGETERFSSMAKVATTACLVVQVPIFSLNRIIRSSRSAL